MLFVLLFSFIVLSYQEQYGVVIDAGSSGSRLYIYSWEDRISKDLIPKITIPQTRDGWNKRISPGFSTFVDNYTSLEAHLTEIISFGKEFFKNESRDISDIPLYFYATAGARMLHVDERNKLMEKVREILSKTGFYFKEVQCRIISGEEEGLFAWISVNYLKGTLLKPDEVIGTLELGGASMQIALYYTKDILAHLFHFNLNSTLYQLYIHSYLQYGIVEAMKLGHQQLIVNSLGQNIQLDHPCFPEGYNFNYTYNNTMYTFIGKNNYDQCHQISTNILRVDETCHVPPCSFLGTYQPNFEKDPNYQFIAFSAFDTVKMRLSKEVVQISEINDFAKHVCQMTYDEILGNYTDDIEYSSEYCFYFNYVYNLFHKGFHFDESRSLRFPGEIDGKPISWTTGAMLLQANLLPTIYDMDKDSNTPAIISLGALSGVLLLTTLILTFCICKYKKRSLDGSMRQPLI